MTAADRPRVVVVEVLDERAAERDVDHLLAAADAEHGQPFASGLLEQAQLRVVELPVDLAEPPVRLLAVEGRVDVPPARQQQPVHVGQLARADPHVDSDRTRGLYLLAGRAVVAAPTAAARGAAAPPRVVL